MIRILAPSLLGCATLGKFFDLSINTCLYLAHAVHVTVVIIMDLTLFVEQLLCARHCCRNTVNSCEKTEPSACLLGAHVLMKETGNKQMNLEDNIRDKWHKNNKAR